MSETLDPVATELDHRQLAEQLLGQAKEQGVELVGPNGLLNQLTKNVLETALDAEMAEHLGYDKHDPVGRVGAQIFPRGWAQLIPRVRSSMDVSTWMFGGLSSQRARGACWVGSWGRS